MQSRSFCNLYNFARTGKRSQYIPDVALRTGNLTASDVYGRAHAYVIIEGTDRIHPDGTFGTSSFMLQNLVSLTWRGGQVSTFTYYRTSRRIDSSSQGAVTQAARCLSSLLSLPRRVEHRRMDHDWDSLVNDNMCTTNLEHEFPDSLVSYTVSPGTHLRQYKRRLAPSNCQERYTHLCRIQR
jgi:hypothetical protein